MNTGQHGRWQTPVDPQQLERQTEDMMQTPSLEDMQALARKLLGLGLEEWETSVLIARDVGGLTFEEIAEDGGYTTTGAVIKIYRRALDKATKAYAREAGNG